MSRPNKPRLLDGDRALMRRVVMLCEEKGIKFPELAERMTALGAPIQVSALYKMTVEPPRVLKAVEAQALAMIFETTVDELMTPINLVMMAKAREVAEKFISATKALDDAHADVVRSALQLADLAKADSDLAETVSHLWQTASPARQWFGEFVGKVDEQQLSMLVDLAQEFWNQTLNLLDGETDD